MNPLEAIVGLLHSPATSAAGWGALTTFVLCVLLVITKRWHGRFSLDETSGVQKFHKVPTPRVGGLGLMGGLLVGWFALSGNSEEKKLLAQMLMAGLPAFVFGIAEDVTKKVGVRERLLATISSGLLACWFTGYSITRVEVVGLDLLLSWFPFSVLFTAFAVGGFANAINIIDGFNGLASGTIIICLSIFAVISYIVGDISLFLVSLILMAVCIGFLIVNFPYGKIFLGDGGAYLMGFLLAWVAVMLPMRNPGVSVWASLLVCGYPLLEVIFSVRRKLKREGHHPGMPDKVHLHMLIFRRISRVNFSKFDLEVQNGLTSPYLWCFSLLAGIISIIFYSDALILFFCFLIMAFFYNLIYIRLTNFKWLLFNKNK
jgi:UDP-N-acetylmuramyl pentapeptide phosphotransferase/UDP-N-acetylglucosamine-1-phosphate transferase